MNWQWEKNEMDHPFEVGKEYRNRRGRYEVVAIDGPKMRIRYEDGHEMKVTISIQTQILEGIQLEEAAQTAKPKGSRRKPKSTAKGKKVVKPKDDRQEKRIAEILEDDEAIFEILTRLVIPPGQINTYRFLLRSPDDYFSLQQIADETRDSDNYSLGGVLMAFGKRIGSSPDPRVRSLKPYNSLFFTHKKSGGKMHYRIRQRVAEIFETYPKFYDFLMNDNRAWLPDEFGSPGWSMSPKVHKLQLQYFGFLDRYQNQDES